jgi:hypothetical protein
MKRRHYSLITAIIGVIAVWFFMWHKAGDSIASCTIITVLIIRQEAMNLAQKYIGDVFRELENMFNLHGKQIDLIRKMTGLDDTYKQN